MGFFLVARNKKMGEAGHFHANITAMLYLRSAMIAAGVEPELVYGKFVSNDGYRVTALESRTIAGNMRAWLIGKNLVIDLSEKDAAARRVSKAVLGVFETVQGRKKGSLTKLLLKPRRIPYRLDRKTMSYFRRFADFSERSSGFGVY